MSDHSDWFVDNNREFYGPIPFAELRVRVADGRVRPTDLVSPDGRTWTPVAAVTGLTFAAPPAPPAAMLGSTVGSDVLPLLPGYVVERMLGSGAFGVVVQARQVKLDRVVALKTVPLDRAAHPAATARFEAEAVALARVQHPNVVTVYDAGHNNGRAFIAMELLAGEDLGHRLERAGPLDERTAWLIVRQAAAGLAHAGTHGVIHRDVKPANLFLIPPPTGFVHPAGVPMVKVTDFGLALVHDLNPAAPSDRPRLTGTPIYMAPEVFRGAVPDHRADIYSLGVTAYYALAGKSPYAASDLWDVMAKKPDPLPPVGPPVGPESAGLVAAMTAPDPDRRVGGYDELFARIDSLACLRGSRLIRVVPVPTPGGRTRALLLATLAVGGGVVAAAAWRWAGPAWVRSAGGTRFVSGSYSENLFDGEHVVGWRGTGWRRDWDDEGNAVLTGQGRVVRAFPPMTNYRVVIGLDLFEATAVEVTVAAPDDADPPRLVARITRAGGAVVGTRAGDDGELTPLAPAAPYPPAAGLTDRSPYLELRYERAGGVWHVFFDGREVAAVPDAGRPTRAEVRIVADGGAVRIASAEVEDLREAANN